MAGYVNELLFGIYPYVALSVFIIGSIIRFDREQYTWKSDSSQLLARGQLRLGSNLFHVGILGIFFGHLGGLLTPLAVWHALGVSAGAKQLIAIVAGGFFGVMMLVGLLVLIHRRLTQPRVRATTKAMDWIVLWLLLAQLSLGLATLPLSGQHLDGSEMVKFMTWAQRVVTFQGDAASLVASVSPIFKLHLLIGMTIFLVFPFSRLVHIWSGFASVFYAIRPYQVVRGR
jgi:nitrate reductase gamma subunit